MGLIVSFVILCTIIRQGAFKISATFKHFIAAYDQTFGIFFIHCYYFIKWFPSVTQVLQGWDDFGSFCFETP